MDSEYEPKCSKAYAEYDWDVPKKVELRRNSFPFFGKRKSLPLGLRDCIDPIRIYKRSRDTVNRLICDVMSNVMVNKTVGCGICLKQY